MKNKNFRFIFSSLIILLFNSCNTPPEKYQDGIKYMDEKKWDKAIEAFNEVTEENQDWLDSAQVRKQESFSLMVDNNQWKKIFRVLEEYADDYDFFDASVVEIENYFTNQIGKGNADSVLFILDENRVNFDEFIDTNFFKKQLAIVEDTLFAGLWIGEDDHNEIDLYFQREGDVLNGMSNKCKSWYKKPIIYKDQKYESNKRWNIMPLQVQYDYWGYYTGSYYSKKGSLTLIGRDTILIDYEALGKTARFHRDTEIKI